MHSVLWCSAGHETQGRRKMQCAVTADGNGRVRLSGLKVSGAGQQSRKF